MSWESTRAGVPPMPDGVPRGLLRDAVFTRMLANILSGTYRRGQRFRLEEIAQDMRVSRTPVREALVPLEALHLVSVQRYVGVVIADWRVEHIVERVRMVRMLLEDPAGAGTDTGTQWLAQRPRQCMSDAGAFMLIAEWALRRQGCPVGADWVAAQRPVVEMFYRDEIACVHGIDAQLQRKERLACIEAASAAAARNDIAAVTSCLGEYVLLLVRLQERFRHQPAGRRMR